MSSAKTGVMLRPMEAPPPLSRCGAAFEVVEPAAVEGLWRAFEDEAVCSPYQRFDWVQSYAEARAGDEGFTMRVLLLRDNRGRPLLLLPLAVRRRQGLVLASFTGGKHANFNLPITAPGFADVVGPAELRRMLIEAGRILAADAFVFLHQPLSWRGEPNPLVALGGSPGANSGFKFALSSNPDETLTRVLSREARRKMRQRTRGMSELGELRFWQARTPQEVDAILNAFFEQKQARFHEAKIHNPFQGSIQTFVRRACLAGLDRGHPAIELYALSIGDRIVATRSGAGDRWRFSAMFSSFDGSKEVSRHSPGSVLLNFTIQAQCELGRKVFDLGLGEGQHKTSVCEEVEDVIDVLLPLTWRGAAGARLIGASLAAKRFIKHTAWARRAATMLRSTKVSLLD
jgi:CelD/BcsL family acetyltransferase involved in cellulose biosynthesis